MTAIIFIIERIADGGLGTALIQKKQTEEADYNTVFTGNLVVSLILYITLFFCAPLISSFYSEPRLIPMLRTSGIAVFLTSFNSIQTAQVYRNYQIKKIFISSFLAAFISGVIAILLAHYGFGVWAIVYQSVASWIINVVTLQILLDWKPKFHFNIKRFLDLFSFSWKIMISTLSGTILENLYNLSIGKYYSSQTLGYYNRGNLFPAIIVGEVRTAVAAVTFPYLSEKQDEKTKLIISAKKVTHLCALIMLPLAAGLAAIASPMVSVLLTDKWLTCVYFLRIECIFYGALSISATLGNILKAVGRSEVVMKLELMKLLLTVICIFTLHSFDIKVLCIARVSIAVIIIIINAWYSGRIVGYGFKELWGDIYKPLLISLFMGTLVYLISFIDINNIMLLMLQIIAGVVIYTLGVICFMKNDVIDILKLINIKKGKSQ